MFPAIKDLTANHIYQQREHDYCWEALFQKKINSVQGTNTSQKLNLVWSSHYIRAEKRRDVKDSNSIKILIVTLVHVSVSGLHCKISLTIVAFPFSTAQYKAVLLSLKEKKKSIKH